MSLFSNKGLVIGTIFAALSALFTAQSIASEDKDKEPAPPFPENPIHDAQEATEVKPFKGQTPPTFPPSDELKELRYRWDKKVDDSQEEVPETNTPELE